MVNVGRLQLEIGFRNCRTDIENSREVEFTEKKLNIVTLNVMPMAMKPSARIAVEALFAVLPALPAVSP
jgi:hypothetical protein